MPKKMEDLTGKKFNMLTVIRFVRKVKKPKSYIWLVKCECGVEKEMDAHSIKRSISCGCYRLKVVSETSTKDLTGQRFGRLLVIERCGSSKYRSALWLVRCDCGNEKTIEGSVLISGKVVSCGCYNSEKLRNNTYKQTHGKSGTRLYKTWENMKERCYNTNNPRYYTYGDRGITVCDEWKDSFETFYDWAMFSGYKDDLTIDRINVNNGYCPENCQWLTFSDNTIKRNTTDRINKNNKIPEKINSSLVSEGTNLTFVEPSSQVLLQQQL